MHACAYFLNLASFIFVISSAGSKGKQRKHIGGKKQKLRRLINLVEVAANFCREYSRLDDIETFLRSNPNAIRCICAIAAAFREIVDTFMGGCNNNTGNIPKPLDINVGPVSIRTLIPNGEGTQSTLMNSRCIRLIESEYEALNNPIRPPALNVVEEGAIDGGCGVQSIQPSAVQGIFLL